MDVADLDILGPFAGFYKKALKESETKITKQSVAPGTSADTAARRQCKANFDALYKKKNVKFFQDPEARRQGRQRIIEANRKMRRSQIIQNGRQTKMSEMTNEFNHLIQEDSSNETTQLLEESGTTSEGSLAIQDKLMVSQSQSRNNNISGVMSNDTSNGSVKDASIVNKNVTNLNNAGTKRGGTTPSITTRNGVNVNSQQDQNKKPPPASKPISQSRHDQLQKWKKEKEAADLQSKRTQKQAFKVGAPVVTKPVKSTSSTSLSKTANSTSNASTLSVSSKNASSVSIPGSKPKPAAGITTRQPTVPTTGRVPVQSTVASRVGAKPVPATAATNNNGEDVRRITRAMSKVQTPSASSNVGNPKASKNGTGLGIAKPPIQKMKTLNINDKTTATARPGAGRGAAVTGTGRGAAVTGAGRGATVTGAGRGTAVTGARPTPGTKAAATTSASATGKKPGVSGPVASSSSQKTSAKKVAAPAKVNNGVEETETSNGNDQPPQQTAPAPVTSPPEQTVAVVKKKKAKPKAIDAIYTDYNGRFSDACRKLGSLGVEWRKILEENKELLSEELDGDINSDLGKVKLLLESKLPQFGELLYAYLLKDEDATIILGCDLEGWWDVAVIQVEAVYKRFEMLTEIKNNNWKKPEPPPPPSFVRTNKKPLGSSSSQEGASGESENFAQPQPPRRPKPAVKAQASGGLKAFLAKQRQMSTSVSGVEEVNKIDTVAVTDQQAQPMDISISLPTSSIQEISSNEHNIHNSEDTRQSTSSRASLTLNLNQSHQDSGKMFEGGFFTISSPLSTATPRGSRRRQDSNTSAYSAMSMHDESMQNPMTPVSAVPVVFRTPNRQNRMSGVSSDASLRRASLSMLGVRKSMGSFSKIGVVSVFQEEKHNERDAMLI